MHYSIEYDCLPRIISSTALTAILPAILWSSYRGRSVKVAFVRIGVVACAVLFFQLSSSSLRLLGLGGGSVLCYYFTLIPGSGGFVAGRLQDMAYFLPTIMTIVSAFITASKLTVVAWSSENTYVPCQHQATSRQYERGMKWYYFLIYFALIVGPIISVYSGVLLLDEEEILTGLLTVALAAYGLFVRFQLAGYKFNAPAHLIAYYSLNLGLSVIETIAEYIEAKKQYDWIMEMAGKDMASYVVLTLVVMAASSFTVILCNRVYFKKRDHLFLY